MNAATPLIDRPEKSAYLQENTYRLQLSWKYININLIGLPYIGSQPRIRLNQIYVPLTFHPLRGDVEERTELEELLFFHPYVILLGGPGSGKSLICQVLAYAFAREGGETFTQRLGINRIPILIKLRNYDATCWQSIDDMLADYIQQLTIDCRSRLTTEWLKKHLEHGHCILLFDGIDEIGNGEAREQFRQFFIQHIADDYLRGHHQDRKSYNLVVLTSRLNGYSEVPFDDASYNTNIHPWVVNQFDSSDINRFLVKWYQACEEDKETRAFGLQRIRQSLTNDAQLRILASNPLLLTMMTLVNRSAGGLPVDRIDLYNKIIEAYLVDIPRSRGFKVFDVPIRTMKRWLAELASSMRERIKSNSANSFTRNFSLESIEKADAIKVLTNEASLEKEDAEKFLDYILTRCGLLVELSPSIFSFPHSSLQEHLFAWKLRGMLGEFSKLSLECQKYVADTSYHEILVQLFLLLTEFEGLPDKLFNTLYEEATNKINIKKLTKNTNIAVFFSRLIRDDDHGLSKKSEKNAINFALDQCCKQLNISIIKSINQASSNRKNNIIERWFDSRGNNKYEISPTQTDYLVTALMTYPTAGHWEKKLANWIDSLHYYRNAIPDNAAKLDETTKNYFKTLITTVSFDKNKSRRLRSALDFCLLFRTLRPIEVINRKSLSITRDVIPTMASITHTFCAINGVTMNQDRFIWLERDDISVTADFDSLETILYNLIENAIKYSGYNYKCNLAIHIRSIDEKTTQFSFEDTGIGIIEEDKDKIFEQNFRGENARRLRAPGINIMSPDLAYCKKLAKRMNGNLTLKNTKNPTIFELTLDC